jgi:hypothetical protein
MKTYLAKAAAVAPPPAQQDYSPSAMTQLNNIYLNNQLGDCVIAAGYHMVAVATGNAGGPAFTASNAQIIADYGKIGGYDPNAPLVNGENPTDQGCDELTALNYWCQKGFANGTKGAAWIAIDASDRNQLATAAYLFENVFLTLDLPDAFFGPNGGQNAPTASGFTWDAAGPPNPADGHAIVGVGYNTTGVKIDTWGMLGTMTWAAIAQYCTESAGGGAYAMLTPDILLKGQQKSPAGIDWNSLLDDIDALGAGIPVISSAKTVSATVNQAVNYKITASNRPTSFGAVNLAAGLTVNTATGAVTGKPTAAGTVQTTLTATNASGSGGAIVTFTITGGAPPKPTAPVITSASVATATIGKPFTYRITAKNNATSFAAVGLPAGLSVNASTGVIFGTPGSAGTVQITISATNAAGKGAATLKLTIKTATPVPPKPQPSHPPNPPSSSGIPPSSGVPTSGEPAASFGRWTPPPTYTIPPIPAAQPENALADMGRQLLDNAQGSRKLGILAASGLVLQGLLAIVSMTEDDSGKNGR